MGLFDKLNQLVSGLGFGDKSTKPPYEKKTPARKSEPSPKQVQSLGIDISPVLNTPEMRKILVDHATDCCNAIKSIPEQHRGKVAEAVLANFYGTCPEGQSLVALLQAIHPMSKAEAKTIAQDQTSKLTARFNQARHEAVGGTQYIWRTTANLCNHAGREAKKFKWKTPPPGGHPGQAHLCSCYAEPVIDPDMVIRHATKKR